MLKYGRIVMNNSQVIHNKYSTDKNISNTDKFIRYVLMVSIDSDGAKHMISVYS